MKLDNSHCSWKEESELMLPLDEAEVCQFVGRWLRLSGVGLWTTGHKSYSVTRTDFQHLRRDIRLVMTSLGSWVLLTIWCSSHVQANWNEWWTYDGISGPAYWGLINPAWTMCNKVIYQKEEHVKKLNHFL